MSDEDITLREDADHSRRYGVRGHHGGRPLRVALVHSYYSSEQTSGENTQVDAEVTALKRAGIEARVFAARTDDLAAQPFYRTRAAARVATGRGRSPSAELGSYAPDVVHVHNLFPNFGRAWIRDVEVPVVATLHNFRTMCAAGNLFRDGHLCTDCADGKPLPGLQHRCYRGSFAATAPLTISQWRGPAADPVIARADRILCLSGRQQRMLARAGVEAARLERWTNFLPESLTPTADDGEAPRGSGLFVGRLTPEKGCHEMLRAWPRSLPLRVVGHGPLAAEVRDLASSRSVDVVASLPRHEVLELMRRSSALLMPSGWPEGLPLVFLEALACGLPVVVRRECDVADHVAEAGLGAVVDKVEDMAEAAIELTRGDRQAIAARCRRVFMERYTEEVWVTKTLGLYSSLVRASGGRRTSSLSRKG